MAIVADLGAQLSASDIIFGAIAGLLCAICGIAWRGAIARARGLERANAKLKTHVAELWKELDNHLASLLVREQIESQALSAMTAIGHAPRAPQERLATDNFGGANAASVIALQKSLQFALEAQ